MTKNQAALAISVLAAFGAYAFATVTEFALISAVRPSEQELTWISDAVLAITVGSVTYLWQHLRMTRATLSSIERDRVVVDTQLSLAADLQRSLLPVLPSDMPRVQWAAELQPAGKVGGDFYDFVRVNGTSATFVLGDISGKGIPAAMLLAYTRAVFRTLARDHQQPAELAQRLSTELHRDTGGHPYVTCIVCHLDAEAGTLTYANCGHPSGLLITATGTTALDRGGPPAGLLPDAVFVQGDVQLQRGDLVVLVTDGVTEALPTAAGSASEQIRAALRQLGDHEDPMRATRTVLSMAARGGGPEGIADWQDDRTVFSFHYSG
jgi:sigma-B regulation protein RsbU (phosphoserine phosphatase)